MSTLGFKAKVHALNIHGVSTHLCKMDSSESPVSATPINLLAANMADNTSFHLHSQAGVGIINFVKIRIHPIGEYCRWANGKHLM